MISRTHPHTEHTSARASAKAGDDAPAEICLEVIEVLRGVFALEKRSETLDGSIPLRAAQGCKPLLDGNAAGFHVRFTDPAAIEWDGDAAFLNLTDAGGHKADEGFAAKLEDLVARGLLVRDGYWHRELSQGFVWTANDTLFVWTGYLVRPVRGVWLLVSSAYNRRCLVDVAEYVITDDDAFIPLILPLDLTSLRGRDATWLDTELACLTPLRPDVEFTITTLDQMPDVGRAWCDFYDASYLDPRSEGKYIGRYRKTTARETGVEGPERAECKLVVFGGPNIHEIGTFNAFATADGRSAIHPDGHRLQFGLIRNIAAIEGRWDGMAVRDITADLPGGEPARMLEGWARVYGAGALPSIEWLARYAHYDYGPHRGEPNFLITPWVFAVTPQGWSSVVDAFRLGSVDDGMRGVVATDTYFGVPPLWYLYAPGRLTAGRGRALARAWPTPRRLLQATFRNVSLDDGA